MGKIVGIAEFKANCTRLLSEMERDGEPITITKRGKRIAELKPLAHDNSTAPLFGCLAGSVTLASDLGPEESGFHPDWEQVWEANNPPELYSSK